MNEPREGAVGPSSGDRGATSVEYAIMGSAIAAVIVLVVGALGLSTQGLFQSLLDLWP